MTVQLVNTVDSALPPDDDHPYRTGVWRPQVNEFDAWDMEVEGEIPDDLSGVYLRNTDKDLSYADTKVQRIVRSYRPMKGSDPAAHAMYVANCKRQRQYFSDFKAENLGQVAQLEAVDLNLSDGENIQQLVAKGYSIAEARAQITLKRQQEKVIAELKVNRNQFRQQLAQTDRMMQAERKDNELRYFVIQANDLGWVNVDRFFELPNAEPGVSKINHQ